MKSRNGISSEYAQELIPRFYFPQFQPVVNMVSGEIVGFESLMRCVDRTSNTVSAAWLFDNDVTHDWIQLEIDRSVRRKAIERFALDKLAGDLYLNVSPSLLNLRELVGDRPTVSMVEQLGIAPERVVVELTETGGDIVLVRQLIRAYKDAGFKVAINDLGLDAEQLEDLMTLQPDYLKLRLADFRHLATASRHNQVILALNLLRKNKYLEVICEGVESEEDFFFAMDCGAHKIKGWMFGSDTTILPKRDAYVRQVGELKGYYHSVRKARLEHHTAKKNVWAGWLKLVAMHHLKGRINKLKFEALVRSGILRYFICNAEGIQQGASINFRPNGYFFDTSYDREDWSKRPYFSMTKTLFGMKRGRYLISNIYVDISCRQSCITLSTLIGQNTILFLDVLANEQLDQGGSGRSAVSPSVKLSRVK